MNIENTTASMVQLWRMLERTEEKLRGAYRRFCPRTILKRCFPARANDNFIWEVCRLSALEGYEELPNVRLYPRKHRNLLAAIIVMITGIGIRQVNYRALDQAFSIAFPHATRLNVSKKRRN